MDKMIKGGYKRRIAITLPDEFLELCKQDMVSPERVLCEFIADLCDITSRQPVRGIESYVSNGVQDRDRARAYYERIHTWRAEWFRENVPHLVKKLWDGQEDDSETGTVICNGQ